MRFFQKVQQKITDTTQSVSKRFVQGLQKTRKGFAEKIEDLIVRRKKIDEQFYEELEEILIGSDVGIDTTMSLLEHLRTEVRIQKIQNAEQLQPLLRESLMKRLTSEQNNEITWNSQGLTIILVVGVNGVGKTTTIGKLAHRFKQQGKKVMLAAGDTFRAGAIEQLEVWGERSNVEVIKQQFGADPAAVIYDALQAAKSRHMDVLLCDTAGRLQNKVNLMEELNKMYRVIQREVPGAPQEVLMVLDATTGQNALHQVKQFDQKSGVTGIVLTKLDGTAKGGIVIAIHEALQLPVKFVGLGEKIDDLEPFYAESFVNALFTSEVQKSSDEEK